MRIVLHTYFAVHPVLEQYALIAVGIVYLLLLRLSACDTTEIEQLLASAVVDALHAAHIELKAAADLMRVDYPKLTRQLKCEKHYPLSLTALIRLPFTFWMFFLPALVSLVYRKRLAEFGESVEDMRRAG